MAKSLRFVASMASNIPCHIIDQDTTKKREICFGQTVCPIGDNMVTLFQLLKTNLMKVQLQAVEANISIK